MKRIKKVMFILSKTLLISCLTACSTQGNITPSNEGEENIESPPRQVVIQVVPIRMM